MAIIIPDEYYTRRGYTAYKGLNLWYAELKPNAENKVTFYVYGAKEKITKDFAAPTILKNLSITKLSTSITR